MEYPGIGCRFFEFFSEEKIFESILDIVSCLKGRKLAVVGYGIGGVVAMNFATKYHDLVANLFVISPCIPSLSMKNFVFSYFSRKSGWSWMKSWYGIGSSNCEITNEEWQRLQMTGMTFQKWNEFVHLFFQKTPDYYFDHLQSPLCSFQTLFISPESCEVKEKYASPQIVIEGSNHYSIVMSKYWDKVIETIDIFVKSPDSLTMN